MKKIQESPSSIGWGGSINISQLFIFVFIASESAAGNETDVPSIGQSAIINNEKIALDSSSDTSFASDDGNVLVIL